MDNPTKATLAISAVLIATLVYFGFQMYRVDDNRVRVVTISALVLMHLYAWARYKLLTRA